MNSLRRGFLGGAAAVAMTIGLNGIAAAGPVNQSGLVNVTSRTSPFRFRSRLPPTCAT